MNTTKADLFRPNPIQSVGDHIRNKVKSGNSYLPDLSYEHEDDIILDYDQIAYEQGKSPGKRILGTALTIGGAISTLTGNIWALPATAIGLNTLVTNTPDAPKDYDVFDYTADSFTNFLNTRDETNVNSERGRLIYDIVPKIEENEYELDYLTRLQNLDQAYRDGDLQSIKQLNNEIKQMAPDFDQLIENRFRDSGSFRSSAYDNLMNYYEQPLDERIQAAQMNIDALTVEQQKANDNIVDIQGNVWDREMGNNWLFNHKISEFYTEMDETTDFGFFNIDSWLYNVPGTLGSSFAFLEDQAYGIGAAYLANLGRTYALRAASAATLSPQIAAAGQLAAHAFAIAGTGASIWATLSAREKETYAELYESYNEKVRNAAQRSGINLGQLINEAREYYSTGNDPEKINRLTDDQVLDMVMASHIPTSSDEFNQIRKEARNGLDHLYYQNMALAASDVAQLAIAIPFVGNVMKGALGGAKLSSKVTAAANKAIDNTIDYGTRVAPRLAAAALHPNTKAFGKYVGSGIIGKTLLTGISEAYEEANQYIGGQNYINDKYRDRSSGLAYGIWDNINSIYDASLAVIGLGDPLLANDDELFQNMIAGAMIGSLMTGPISTPKNVKALVGQIQANKFVRNVTAEQIKTKEDFAKAKMYAQQSLLNNKDNILVALEGLKNNLPEGVTTEDIDAEIERANRVMSIAGSPFIKSVSGDLNIPVGSNRHSNLISMVNHTYEKYKNESAENSFLHNAYTQELTKDKYFQLTNSFNPNSDVAPILKNVEQFLHEEQAINDLINYLTINKEQIEDMNKKFAMSLDSKTIGSYISRLKNLQKVHSELKTNLNEALEDAQAKFTVQDILENSKSNYHSPDLTIAYQKTLLSDLSLNDAFRTAAAFNGVYHPVSGYEIDPITNRIIERRSERLYQTLDQADKAEVQKIIKEKLDAYEKAEEMAKNMREVMAREDIIEEDPVITQIPDAKIEDKEDPIQQLQETFDEAQTKTNEVAQTETPDTVSASATTEAEIITEQSAQTIQDIPTPVTQETVTDPIIKTDDLSNISPEDLWARSTSAIADSDGNPVLDNNPDITETSPQEEQTPITEYTDSQIRNANAFEQISNANSEQLNNGIANEEIPGVIFPGMGNRSQYGKTSNTMFYDPNSINPMKEGLRPGKELGELLADPNNVEFLEYEIVVDNWNGKFDINNRFSYDEAAIMIIITDTRNNNKYGAAMKTPDGAIRLHNSLGIEGTSALQIPDVARLNAMRDNIIELYARAQTTGGKLVPTQVFRSNGLFNSNKTSDGRVINRNLSEVKGLQIPTEKYAITNGEVRIGIGGGIRNDFKILDHEGYPMRSKLGNYRGGSGKVFIEIQNTPSGTPTVAQLNERKLSQDPEIVDLVFDLLVKRGANIVEQLTTPVNGVNIDNGLTPKTLLDIIINNGKKTMVPIEEREKLPFLINKQLWFNQDTQQVHIGDTVYDRQDLLTNEESQREFKTYLAENFHWNTNKDMVWGRIGETHEDLKEFFRSTNEQLDKVVIVPGKIEFTLEDVGMIRDENGIARYDTDHNDGHTWLSWYVKNGILQSDLKDQVFKNPFLYIEDVRIEEPDNSKRIIDNEGKTEVINPVQEITEQQATAELTPEQLWERASTMATDEQGNPIFETDEVIDEDVMDVDAFLDSDEFKDFIGGSPRVYTQSFDKVINTKKAVDWLKSKLVTEDQIDITDTVITLGRSGIQAMGLTKEDSIILWDNAEIGTEFHEAFHRVSLLLLTPDERNGIYNSYRALNNSTLPNTEVEERLAEGFRDYKLSKTKRLKYKINKFFNKLLNFVGAYRNLSNDDIYNLYEKIASGQFKNAPVNQESVSQFREVYKEGAPFKVGTSDNPIEFKYIPTLSNYYNIVNSLQAILFVVNGVRGINDINKLNTNKLKAFLKGALASKRFTPQQKLVLAEVLANFDTFNRDLQQSMENLSLRNIDITEEQRLTDIENGDVNASDIQNYDRASYEISKKDNALASAKIFMATIVDKRFEYSQGPNGTTAKETVTVTDPLTGLPQLVDFDKSWNLLLNNLYDIETLDDMKRKSDKLAKTIPFFETFSKKLEKGITESLGTQLLQTIKSNKHNMFFIGYKGYTGENEKDIKIGFRVDSSDTAKASRLYPKLWGSAFYSRSGIVKTIDGKQSIDKVLLNNILKRYNNIVTLLNDDMASMTSVSQYKELLVGVLNEIGISVDVDTLNQAIVASVPYLDPNTLQALNKYTSKGNAGSLEKLFNNALKGLLQDKPLTYIGKGGKKINKPLEQIFAGEESVRVLSEAYATVHPRLEELSVLGAEGNLLYPISENNYMSDMVRWLNKAPEKGQKFNETLDNLDKVTYNKNSILLRNLKSGNKIQLNTFANFTEESAGDRGRDYFGISPLEDYISKMVLTANDHIVLPTMADKKTYFTISGVKLFHYPINIVRDQTQQTLRLNNKILSQFVDYATDEWNSIKQFYSDTYQQTLKDHPEKVVKNYHTKKLGGRFRYFTGIWLNVNGQPEFTDLNKLLDDYDATGRITEAIDLIEEQFFARDPIFKQNAINELLKQAILREIANADRLGLIGAEEVKGNRIPRMYNKLLDQVVLADKINYYKTIGDPELESKAETYAIYDMLADYTINTLVSITEVEKVFIKDPAYYKNTDDKIKRLSEVLSTGANLRTEWPVGSDMVGRTTYSTTELNDNEISSGQFDELRELFVKSYERKIAEDDISLSPEEVTKAARIKAEIDVAGYGDNSINQTDAAVYISPKMYKDIVRMLGDEEWTPEIEAAFNLMESDTDWLASPAQYAEAMTTLIKPLKMTSFGDNFDPELGLDIPIYDKMALFPLFKVLATGDNRVLYDRMTSQGEFQNMPSIDMVKFSSAVKVGSRKTMSFYKNAENTEINDLREMQTYAQEFKYLRRQLITDPHTAERQLLGTQAAKGALSNLDLNREYGRDTKYTGEQIRNEVFGTMNALSNLGATNLLNQLGKINDGVWVQDIEKFAKLLAKDAKQSGLPFDVQESLKTTGDKLDTPLSAISNSSWIESRWTSMVNRETIDLNLPGGAYIQMSSFGFKSITPVSDRALNDGERLRFRNTDGSMDAMVSLNLFSHIIPTEFKRDHVTARKWLLDNKIIGKDSAPAAMGYRIPTQGLSSISALKIVDVLPSVIGDTIVLPDEFTKLTGSDFDIDKLYLARYNYDKNGNKILFDDTVKDEDTWNAISDRLRSQGFDEDVITRKYLTWIGERSGKTKWDLNSREANENRLLDMYMMVLTDDFNVDETRLPLDNITSYLKSTILSNVDGPLVSVAKAPYYDLSPSFQLAKKYEYTGGKSGIGPFALNNVHHVLTQLTNLEFIPTDIITSKYDLVSLHDVVSRDINQIRILDWLSAMINAHVDVAKDPYIIRLNVVQWTYNMANLLLRTGVGENTFYFLPQQILKDMAEAVASTNGRYGIDTTKSQSALERNAVDGVYDQYLSKAKALAQGNKKFQDMLTVLESDFKSDPELITKASEAIWNTDFLLEQLKKSRDGNLDFNWYYNQLLIYKVYDELTPYARGLSELVQVSKVDTKKFGNNFMLQKSFMYQVKNTIMDSGVFTTQSIRNFFKNTFLDTKLRNSVIFSRELFKDKLIKASDQFAGYHNAILALLGQSNTRDERLINGASNALESSIKSKFFFDRLRSQGKTPYEFYYGENSMGNRLINLKSDIISGKYPEMLDDFGHIKNDLLNYIDGRPGSPTYDEYYSPDYITTAVTSESDKYLQDKLKRYWQELLDSPYEEIRSFADDLVTFAFITSGDNFTMNGIFNLVPIDYRKQIGYTDYIQSVMDNLNEGIQDVNLDDVFKNNWNNSRLVPDLVLSKSFFYAGEYRSDILDYIPSKAPLFSTNTTYPLVVFNKRENPIGVNSDGNPLYRPYLKYNIDKTKNPATTVLYKYVGNYENSESGEIQPVYVAVHKKGLNMDGIVITENDNNTFSQLAYNNLPVEGTFKKSISELLENAYFAFPVELNRYRDMLLNTRLIDDFYIQDPAYKLTYDQIMNEPIQEPQETAMQSTEFNSPKSIKVYRTNNIITRNKIQANPRTLYIFGDNDIRKGLGGQAKEMRGEPNTIGISTKKLPSNNENAFKTDTEFDENARIITEDVNKAIAEFATGKYDNLVIPQIGVGLARLQDKAPRTWEHLQNELNRLEQTVMNVETNIPTNQLEQNYNRAINVLAEEWSSKEGWSTEYFKEKVLPKVQAGEAWQFEYQYIPTDLVPYGLKPTLTGKMTYSYGNNKSPNVTANTTLEAIRNGERTATTRYETDGHIEYWLDANAGAMIKFTGQRADDVAWVRVTKSIHQLNIEDYIQNNQYTNRYDGLLKTRELTGILYDKEYSVNTSELLEYANALAAIDESNIGRIITDENELVEYEISDYSVTIFKNADDVIENRSYGFDNLLMLIIDDYIEIFGSEKYDNTFETRHKVSDELGGDTETITSLSKVLNYFIEQNKDRLFVNENNTQLSLFDLDQNTIDDYRNILQDVMASEDQEVINRAMIEFNGILNTNESIDTKENRIRDLICRGGKA